MRNKLEGKRRTKEQKGSKEFPTPAVKTRKKNSKMRKMIAVFVEISDNNNIITRIAITIIFHYCC